jgi:hypothetical protein
MTDERVAADWAWISKEPTGIAYSVLATSRDDVDFGPFIGRYVPGSPSSTVPPDAPAAPPWVTFGPAATGPDGILMTVSVRDPSRGRDRDGRAVWPQRLFVIRFAELAAADASYRTISDAVIGTAIPDVQSGTLSLPIAAQPLGELIETIKYYGFENLATLAAWVLERPVVVAGAGQLRREQRLAVFDAVAALLPYGFRADLSVSSVVDNTSRHGIRLAFAEFAKDGQQLLNLRAAPQPGTEGSRYYLEVLKEREETSGLGALIKHFRDAKAPYSFQNPGVAVAVLNDLDFYGAFRREAGQGPMPLGMLRRFFSDRDAAARSWASFDTQTRDNALASYLPQREAEAAAVVMPCWAFVGNDVVRLISVDLDRDDAEPALWCLRTAGAMEDRLLGDLLVPNDVTDREARQQRRTMLVELLKRRDLPRLGELGYSCDQLRFDDASAWQAGLVRDLLIRELAGDRGKAWARWLCQSDFPGTRERPDWVTALGFVVLSTPPEQAIASVRSLILDDLSWAAVLLRLASQSQQHGRLRDLLDGAGRQLLEVVAQLPTPAKPANACARLRAELDRSLWPLGVRPGTVASIDVARILLGGTPRDFADPLFPEPPGDYFDGLKSALTLPATESRLAEIQDGFLGYAVPREASAGLSAGGVRLLNTWATDPQLKPRLLTYIASLEPVAYPYHVGLSAAFWNALGGDPELAGYAAGHHLISAVTEALQAPQAALRRARTENAVMSTALALACLNVRHAGLSIRGMVRALHAAEASRISARRLDVVLREFQDLRYREYLEVPPDRAGLTPQTASEAELFECYRLIAAGALGDPFAEEFRRYLTDRLKNEIKTRAWLLENVLSAGAKGAALGSFSDDETESFPSPGAGATPARKRISSWLHWRPRLRMPQRKGDHISRSRRGDRRSGEGT